MSSCYSCFTYIPSLILGSPFLPSFRLIEKHLIYHLISSICFLLQLFLLFLGAALGLTTCILIYQSLLRVNIVGPDFTLHGHFLLSASPFKNVTLQWYIIIHSYSLHCLCHYHIFSSLILNLTYLKCCSFCFVLFCFKHQLSYKIIMKREKLDYIYIYSLPASGIPHFFL